MPFEASAEPPRAGAGAGAPPLHVVRTPARPKPVWLFVDISPVYGGHEVMLLRWIDALLQQGEVVPVLVCVEGSRLAEVASATIRVETVRLAEGSLRNKLVRFGQMLLKFRALKRELSPRVAVVAEGCLMAQRHGLFVSRALGLPSVLYVPLVSSFTEMGVADAERLDRKVLSYYRKLPKAWLTITSQQSDELRRWTGIDQPVFCLPNTVASNFEAAVPQSAPATGPSRVLVLGRLDPHQKGLDRLLDHLRARPGLSGQARVSMVGEGPYLDELLAALNADPALGERLVLEGWQDAATALGKHDVLLIASRFEGVPLVMLEAMAAGVPVVSTDLPGTRPYLPESCLFPFGDLDRAFEAVQALRADPALRAAVVEHNQRAYAELASPAAFEAGVRRLTPQLNALGESA